MSKKKKKDKKNRHILQHIIIVLILLLSIGCLAYPSVAQWWNADKETRAAAVYDDTVEKMNKAKAEQMLKDADAYNQKLAQMPFPLESGEAEEGYDDLLKVDNKGMMGYLEVPVLKINIPIYHYTNNVSMGEGAGHMVGSSLPVGGKSTHAVISAHCGMPDKELFTHLERVQEGDIFTITVLSRKTTYQVDQIKVVLPDDDSDLQIVDGQDYVTLLTCTPFGINDHRLLVRGHRIPNKEAAKIKTRKLNKELTWWGIWKNMDPRLKIFLTFMLITLVIIVIIKICQHIHDKRKKRKKEKRNNL